MKKIFSFLIVFALVVLSFQTSYASEITLDATAKFICSTVTEPTVSQTGGEWAIIGLSRSGLSVSDEYFEKYFENAKKYISEKNGVLHEKKYTEYSRVVTALTAIGKDPADICGYDLLKPLGDFEKTVWQGTNGPVWALIALNCGGYDIPKNENAEIAATEKMYIEKILSLQNEDGGWPLSAGGESDTDITAMALTALSDYTESENAALATERGLSYLSAVQNEDGGFSSRNTPNCESCAQVIVALCSLKIGTEDERFVKNGSVLDALLKYRRKDGSFSHTKNDVSYNLMATEQAFYALVAAKRFENGETSLFDMSDVEKEQSGSTQKNDFGLPLKNPDIKKADFTGEKTFADIQNSEAKKEIEALASVGIINGRGNGNFSPNDTVTRAEFASIITKGLGLGSGNDVKFSDVAENDWFYASVSAAYKYKIVFGTTKNEFNPMGTITKEEAAAMVARAAALCGMDTLQSESSARDILAVFTDYQTVGDWAKETLAFCIKEKIISDEDIKIEPKKQVTRAEVACMVYNMLVKSKLL